MSNLFHDDGCIRPNIPLQTFRAVLVPACEHSKIRGTVIDFRAASIDAANAYVRNWIRLPQMRVHRVYAIDPATVIGPGPVNDGETFMREG